MLPEALDIPASARLNYRMIDASDAPLLMELDQDAEVMRYLNDGKPSTQADIDNYFVPRVMRFTDPATGCGLWKVSANETGEYLGWILVREYGFDTNYREPGNIELGWRLKRHCWGQGIATEAAQAIIAVLRQNPKIHTFSAIADPANAGSIAVMKKLGMHFVDARLHHTPAKVFDVIYYEMPA